MKASHELLWNDKVESREMNNEKRTDALKIQISCKVYVLELKGSKALHKPGCLHGY